MKIIKQNKKETTLEYKCDYCGRVNVFTVDRESYEKWKKGGVNNGLHPVDEERLISSLCPDCWEDPEEIEWVSWE